MVEKKTIPFIPLAVIGGVLLFVGYNLIHVLTPFVLSMALAYVINPAITHFSSRGYKRDPIVILLYLVVALTLVTLTTKLMPVLSAEWTELQNSAPTYVTNTQKFLGALPAKIANRVPVRSKEIEEWAKTLYNPMIHQLQNIPTYLLGLFPLLSLFFLVPFITFFLLIDGNRTIAGMVQACPSRYVEQALYLISEIDTSLGNYLRGIILEASAVGVAAYIGLFALGLDHCLAIAILAAMSSFVPYLGAIMGATVGGLAALIQFGTIGAAFKVVLLFGGIRFVDDWLLQPFISKHSVQLHPLLFLLSLMVGGETLGYIGLVFAIPVACVIKSLFRVAWDWYSSETLHEDFTHIDIGVIPYT